MEPVRSWNRVCDQLCLAAETASDFDLTLFPGVDAGNYCSSYIHFLHSHVRIKLFLCVHDNFSGVVANNTY